MNTADQEKEKQGRRMAIDFGFRCLPYIGESVWITLNGPKTSVEFYDYVIRLAEEAKREVEAIEVATGSLSHG